MELELTERHNLLLDMISDFNMSARYDDYKKEFYNKCLDLMQKEQNMKIVISILQ